MSSNLKEGPTYVEHSTSSSNDNHRPRNPQGLACKACRKRKHLCDRMKPSCTRCLNAEVDCVYADRKPRTTLANLEDELRRLEQKYAVCLKAAKIGARACGDLTESAAAASIRQCLKQASDLARGPSNASGAGSHSHSDDPRSNLSHFDPPFGGYHFDQTFLAIPSYPMEAPARIEELSSESSRPGTSTPTTQSPARIFIPVSRTTSITIPSLPDGLFGITSSHQATKERPAKRQRLKSSFRDTSKPEKNKAGVIDNIASNPLVLPPRSSLRSTDITHAPTLRFSRATWWDCLINTYIIHPERPHAVTSRRDATAQISRDVYAFFRDATFLLSFLNVPMFFDTFYDPERRGAVQPALVLSILAYAKLVQSNLDGSRGESLEDRERAWRQSAELRDLAQGSFDASYNAGWIDFSLAEAAWILVIYEVSPHREYVPHRLHSSLTLLDNIIRHLGLTAIDSDDPRAPIFVSDAVPTIGRPPRNGVKGRVSRSVYSDTAMNLQTPSLPVGYSSPTESLGCQETGNPSRIEVWRYPVDQLPPHLHSDYDPEPSAGCPCQALSLSKTPDLLRSTPSWMYMPKWSDNASLGETMREQARRLVWSSVIILGSDLIPRQTGRPLQLDFHISRPENFALLFPGEANYSSLPDACAAHSGKESNWALWARSSLLWFACMRHFSRVRPHLSPSRLSRSTPSHEEDIAVQSNADFSKQAWMETVAIEDALDAHTCFTEQSMMCQGREVLLKIRMQLSGGFQNPSSKNDTGVDLEPLNRESARKWAQHVDRMGKTCLSAAYQSEDSPNRKMLVDRPFVSSLCLGVMLRAIELWRRDQSLSLALDAAKKLYSVVDWYALIWPCPEFQKRTVRALSELE